MDNKKTILVVDDSFVIRDLIGNFLTRIGYDILLCESGKRAACQCVSQADLMITDFNMPGGMDGVELTKVAKSYKPDMPVIIMTGSLLESLPTNHLADEVISKPFEFEQLKKIIAKLLPT